MMQNLNVNQKSAVLLNNAPLRIIAGAGTGKTTVICEKIKYLINHVALKPHRILAITFTNKAAQEMRERILKDLPINNGIPVIRTYHSFCAKFLRSEISVLGFKNDFIILDMDDQKLLLNNVITARGLRKSDFKPKQLLELFGIWNKENYTIADLEKANDCAEHDQLEIYRDYLAAKLHHNVLDFDDLIIKTHLILAQYPAIAEKWSNFFDYVLVDEFQDTSYLQYHIVKALTLKKQNLCVVGDPDQTIYSWRGANVDIIINLDKDYPTLKTITLNQNYRSPQKILDLSNALISNNKNRIAKNLYSITDDKRPIMYYDAPSTTGEANWVIHQVKKLQNQAIPLSDITILYRLNRISLYLEQALINANLPYKIFGNINFFARKEIKDLISYLWVVVNHNDFYLERIINIPRRAIGNITWHRIKAYADANKLNYFNVIHNHLDEIAISYKSKSTLKEFINVIDDTHQKLKNQPLSECINILNQLFINSGYKEYLKHLSRKEKSFLGNRSDNVEELFKFIGNRLANNTDPTKNTLTILVEILADLSLLSSHNNDDQNNQQKPIDKLQLMTIHNAKGLEFPYVFIVGLNEGIAPFSKSLLNIEEERRIIYVAATRAQKQLFLTSATRFSFEKIDAPLPVSRFIHEIKEHLTVATPLPITTFHLQKPPEDKHLAKDEQYFDDNPDFIIGDLVEHKIFGLGTVVNVENETISIAFKFSSGVKRFLKNHKSIKNINKLDK